jgi:hypothetical protein
VKLIEHGVGVLVGGAGVLVRIAEGVATGVVVDVCGTAVPEVPGVLVAAGVCVDVAEDVAMGVGVFVEVTSRVEVGEGVMVAVGVGWQGL